MTVISISLPDYHKRVVTMKKQAFQKTPLKEMHRNYKQLYKQTFKNASRPNRNTATIILNFHKFLLRFYTNMHH